VETGEDGAPPKSVTVRKLQIGKVSVHPRHCFAIHRADGYEYSFGETFVADGVHAAPPNA